MFTGIVESLGTIISSTKVADGVRLSVDLGDLEPNYISIGDSIAVNGACLTVTNLENNNVFFDVSPETLSKCLVADWQPGGQVNLEKALTLQTPLGGHLVSGHVDGIATLRQRRDEAESSWMQFVLAPSLGRYIAIKGSVTIDGVSLTSNHVFDQDGETAFELTLVPHTLAVTTLGQLKLGQSVHVEIDLIARYLERMAQSDSYHSGEENT